MWTPSIRGRCSRGTKRTPASPNKASQHTPKISDTAGRDHHVNGYSIFMAGGGFKGGEAFGETDEFGNAVARDPVSIHDIHATLLHQMGLDHERLTFRHGGRDQRLTDVHGRVVGELLS